MLKIFENMYNNCTKTEQPHYVKPNIINSPLLSEMGLKNKLKNLDALSDDEIFNILYTNATYTKIFKNLFLKNDPDYFEIVTKEKFLNAMIKVMYNISNIDPIIRSYCNKLAYDYITNESSDPYIKELMVNFSKAVNKDIVPLIVGLGLPEDLSSKIVLSRFSSTKELVNVYRINTLMTNSDIDIFTEQMIVNIYQKLFNRMTPLFTGTMFDVGYGYMDEDMEIIYNRISYAVLDILNDMSLENIKIIILRYLKECKYHNLTYNSNDELGKGNVRFSLNSVPEKYDRIIQVLNHIKQYERISII